jgi:hypothetical protein
MRAGTIHLTVVAILVLTYAAFYASQVRFGIATCIVCGFALIVAASLLLRKAWANIFVYIAVAVNLGYWIYVGTTWVVRAHLLLDPFLLNMERLIPGLLLVVLPSVYCVFVAHRYLRRSI